MIVLADSLAEQVIGAGLAILFVAPVLIMALVWIDLGHCHPWWRSRR